MKKCTKCGETKALDQFNRQTRSKDGRNQRCRDCTKKDGLDRYHAIKHEWNPARNKSRRETKTYRDYSLRRNYGIDLAEYNRILEAQNGVCAICLGPEKQRDIRYGSLLDLAIDHNHKTGEVRGLLCSACNVGIGKLNDNIEILRRAIAYLEKAEAPSISQGLPPTAA